MKLQITNRAALDGVSDAEMNAIFASAAKINDLTARESAIFRDLLECHNARATEFWRAENDAVLSAKLNAFGIAQLAVVFELNRSSAAALNDIAEKLEISARAIEAPSREISVSASGEITVVPLTPPPVETPPAQ